MHMKLYSGSVINSKLCILSSGGCQNYNTVTALDPYVSEHSFGILLGNQNAISYICAVQMLSKRLFWGININTYDKYRSQDCTGVTRVLIA